MYTLIKTTNVVKDKLAYTPIITRYEDDLVVVEVPHAADDYPTHQNGVDQLFRLGYYDDYGWVYMSLVGKQWEVFYIATEYGDIVLKRLLVGDGTDEISKKISDVIVAYHTVKETRIM